MPSNEGEGSKNTFDIGGSCSSQQHRQESRTGGGWVSAGALNGTEDYDRIVFSPVCTFTGPPWKEWLSRTAGTPRAQGRSCEVEDQCAWSDLQREDPALSDHREQVV